MILNLRIVFNLRPKFSKKSITTTVPYHNPRKKFPRKLENVLLLIIPKKKILCSDCKNFPRLKRMKSYYFEEWFRPFISRFFTNPANSKHRIKLEKSAVKCHRYLENISRINWTILLAMVIIFEWYWRWRGRGESAKKQRGNDVGTGNASLRFQAKLLCFVTRNPRSKLLGSRRGEKLYISSRVIPSRG